MKVDIELDFQEIMFQKLCCKSSMDQLRFTCRKKVIQYRGTGMSKKENRKKEAESDE